MKRAPFVSECMIKSVLFPTSPSPPELQPSLPQSGFSLFSAAIVQDRPPPQPKWRESDLRNLFFPSLKVKAGFSCCSLITSVKSFSSGRGRNRHRLCWHWSSVPKDFSIKESHVTNVHPICQKKCNHASLLWERCS